MLAEIVKQNKSYNFILKKTSTVLSLIIIHFLVRLEKIQCLAEIVFTKRNSSLEILINQNTQNY